MFAVKSSLRQTSQLIARRLVVRKYTYNAHENHHNFWQLVKQNSQPISYGDYELKLLSNPKHVKMAQKMVSMVVSEHNWKWDSSDLSDFKVNLTAGRQTDITQGIEGMEGNCVWGGAFKDGELVACLCLMYKTFTTGMNVEKYSLTETVKRMVSNNHIVVTQEAFTLPSHRGKFLNKLLCGMFEMYSSMIGATFVKAFTDAGVMTENIAKVVDNYDEEEKLLLANFPEEDLVNIVDYIKTE